MQGVIVGPRLCTSLQMACSKLATGMSEVFDVSKVAKSMVVNDLMNNTFFRFDSMHL